MLYKINQISSGENELILNYVQPDEEVQEAILFMERRRQKLMGKRNGEVVFFSPEEILYVEKVDDKTFAYTLNSEIQVDLSLNSIELILGKKFFRCSKSMLLNITMVERLKSMPSNRIDVTLQNGEHIVISRTYASEFRRLLKGDRA